MTHGGDMKTAELIGPALDWAVAKCAGKDNDIEVHGGNVLYGRCSSGFVHYSPSTKWEQGGPIIELAHIALWSEGYDWEAKQYGQHESWGPTPLIAAMRCFVASKLGADIDIPEELR
jgi:hypothetical protein